ncbi:MAG TPA: HepT-like ribonuclease domain-containing protein [Tepidisphaeraceae bacterium]|jgi:uncharacterized protein with HEPN domain|nr:HepT-like ribonuclease domain-containing protein [Tepidisphaeraceae bacterium]
MPREQSDASFLWDMLTAARAVASFVTDRNFEQYERDLLLRSAVERQIEIIGEAARRITRAFRDQHPEIPWPRIMGQRHVLAHDYGEIEHDRIWRVATLHIPVLMGQLEPLVPTPPPDPEPDRQTP